VSRLLSTPFLGASGGEAAVFQAIDDILGIDNTDYAIIPIGSPEHENVARTQVTTIGRGAGHGLVCTYSKAVNTWDTPPAFLNKAAWLPRVTFDGVDEEVSSPDADFWTPISGGVDVPFSYGTWVSINNTAANRHILSKWVDETGPEWRVYIRGSDDLLEFTLSDVSVPAVHTLVSDSAPATGTTLFLVGTYDGRGGAAAMDGAVLYEGGIAIAATVANDANYVDMENQAGDLGLGRLTAGGSPGGFWDGYMLGGIMGPFVTRREISSSQVFDLFNVGLAHI